MIKEHGWNQVLVFSRTKHGANKLATQLGKHNIGAVAIHGNKSQGASFRLLDNFKKNKIQILVATDIAARGIDIDHLSHVVNFDLPNVPEDYVHRIGRTGRAGESGQAISLVSADEAKQLHDIERLIKRKINRKEIETFEPQHNLPESLSSKYSRNKQVTKTTNNKTKRYKAKHNGSSEKKSYNRYSKPQNSVNSNNGNRQRRPASTATPAI